jgi:glycosyltransferase involved in cell wall biosynthesis
MKILFVAPGDSLHTSRWIERVKSQGFECVFYDMTAKSLMHPIGVDSVYHLSDFFPEDLENKKSNRFSIISKWIDPFILSLKHFVSLKRVVKVESPDLIHIHWLFHAAALSAVFLRKVPIVSTPWGSDLLTPEYKVSSGKFERLKHKFVVNTVIRKSLAFCCDAPHMKDLLVKFGAKPDSIEIIYFGTDVEVFNPLNRIDGFWSKFGLSTKNLKVLSNRVLANMYDIETFIRASKIVNNQNPEIDFVIAGGGPQSESLKEYARIYGSQKGIVFTGRLSNEDFASATNSCDIYVSTSPTDGGIAASVAEAMSAAVPVLITDFGDNSAWLRSETAGHLFKIGDEKQLAYLITKLASNSELRHSMGQVGRSVIMKDNNSDIEVRKISDLYKRAIKV